MPVLMRESGIDDEVAQFWKLWMNALRHTNPRLLAYLSYMVQRLLPMKGILKQTGSVYLHCDPTASHYIKVMMDAIFGHENFRSEIVWKRSSAHSSAKRYGPIHDTLLFYTNSNSYTWNPSYTDYDESYVRRFYRHEDGGGKYRISDLTAAGTRRGASGQPWHGYDPDAAGRHWAVPRSFPGGDLVPSGTAPGLDYLLSIGRIALPAEAGGMPGFKRYLKDMPGVPLQDMWPDINPAYGGERMGYATQKPLALLKRIIETSSNPGDVVFDPFCGCATTLESAHSLGRRWIGVDIAIHAIKRVARVRLQDRLRLVEGVDFTIDGVPRTVEGARDLWAARQIPLPEMGRGASGRLCDDQAHE